MPPKPTVERGEVLRAAVELVRVGGIEALNARALAKALDCSTKPLFRVYPGMEALRADVRGELDRIYDAFMEERIREENRLLTQGIAYVEFARCEPQIARALFMTGNMKGIGIRRILDAPWNRRTIDNVRQVTGLDVGRAEELFRDVWIYSHGLASQLVSNGIDLPPDEAARLIRDAFRRFALQPKEEIT